MSIATLEDRLERLGGQRTRRFIEFLGVGATGAVLDIAITATTLGMVHYLAANALGFIVAVSWNFAGNWLITFDRPDGRLHHQYLSYVGLHVGTFAIRALVVAAFVELTPTPVMIATLIGIGAAAVANFIASERIFDSQGELWFDAVDAINHLAHALYHSRLRTLLRHLGLYSPLYTTYQHLVGLLYRNPTHTVTAAGASAELYTEHPAEVVSVLHTQEKESGILEEFLTDLQPGDHVWDVGANLGVFAALAATRVPDGTVTAFEPFPETAQRCRENLRLNNPTAETQVYDIALGDIETSIGLAVERDEVGTQTPSVTAQETGVRVWQRRGDAVTPDAGAPSVVKIDVEGAEGDVITGMSETLANGVRLVYCETHDATFHQRGSEVSVRQQLDALGFEVETVESGSQIYLRGEKPT